MTSLSEDIGTESIIERVGRIICEHQSNIKPLCELDEKDLTFIPLNYLKKYVESTYLLQIWDKLPKRYRSDRELQLNLPCYTHYNKGRDQLDGPPLSKRMCCQKN